MRVHRSFREEKRFDDSLPQQPQLKRICTHKHEDTMRVSQSALRDYFASVTPLHGDILKEEARIAGSMGEKWDTLKLDERDALLNASFLVPASCVSYEEAEWGKSVRDMVEQGRHTRERMQEATEGLKAVAAPLCRTMTRDGGGGAHAASDDGSGTITNMHVVAPKPKSSPTLRDRTRSTGRKDGGSKTRKHTSPHSRRDGKGHRTHVQISGPKLIPAPTLAGTDTDEMPVLKMNSEPTGESTSDGGDDADAHEQNKSTVEGGDHSLHSPQLRRRGQVRNRSVSLSMLLDDMAKPLPPAADAQALLAAGTAPAASTNVSLSPQTIRASKLGRGRAATLSDTVRKPGKTNKDGKASGGDHAHSQTRRSTFSTLLGARKNRKHVTKRVKGVVRLSSPTSDDNSTETDVSPPVLSPPIPLETAGDRGRTVILPEIAVSRASDGMLEAAVVTEGVAGVDPPSEDRNGLVQTPESAGTAMPKTAQLVHNEHTTTETMVVSVGGGSADGTDGGDAPTRRTRRSITFDATAEESQLDAALDLMSPPSNGGPEADDEAGVDLLGWQAAADRKRITVLLEELDKPIRMLSPGTRISTFGDSNDFDDDDDDEIDI